MESLEPAVGKPAVERGGHGADCVLEKGEALFDGRGIEGGAAHKNVLWYIRLSEEQIMRQYWQETIPSAH